MKGFSADGYIIDQNQLTDYPYHGMTSDVNGCGWVAAYNLRRAAGQAADFDDVRREMDAMYRLQIPGPTPMRKLRRYLRRYLSFDFIVGKRRVRAAVTAGAAGILRYWEGHTPHFITFVRQADGRCRFFNVADGLEDHVEDMDRFFNGHCRRGLIRAVVLRSAEPKD